MALRGDPVKGDQFFLKNNAFEGPYSPVMSNHFNLLMQKNAFNVSDVQFVYNKKYN
jgi:hypothetical protein